jgi:hypothetical protein
MIRAERGDIWTYEKTHLIVIPTNIGWRSGGENVMGRGLALQAARKYPQLPAWYGEQCRRHGAATPVLCYTDAPLILFPVKPLNVAQPWLSWRSGASLVLIEQSAKELAALDLSWDIAVSLVGCGNGGLEMADVRPILDRHLSDKRFVLVLREG